MAATIDIDDITRVLLADGWHTVYKKSFTLVPYSFGRFYKETNSNTTIFDKSLPGAEWIEDNGSDSAHVITCPLSNVLAVESEY